MKPYNLTWLDISTALNQMMKAYFSDLVNDGGFIARNVGKTLIYQISYFGTFIGELNYSNILHIQANRKNGDRVFVMLVTRWDEGASHLLGATNPTVDAVELVTPKDWEDQLAQVIPPVPTGLPTI